MNAPRGVGAGPRPRLSAWWHHHRQSAADSLAKLLFEPVSTLLTWLVLGIALALPATLLVLLDNVSQLSASFARPAQLSLLLAEDVTEEAAEALRQDLAARPDVQRATLIPRDVALAEFSADTGLGDLLATLPDNPLPHTITLEASPGTDSAGLSVMANALARLEAVQRVVLDTQWIERLQAMLQLARRLVIGVGLMMLVGAVLILGNTLRLAIEARRAEIVVIKLIGGGDGFARRPFLYTGLWFGIGGGVLAVVLVLLLLALLDGPVQQLFTLYGSDRSLTGFGPVAAIQLALVGGAMGVGSAWLSTLLHLRRVEPR